MFIFTSYVDKYRTILLLTYLTTFLFLEKFLNPPMIPISEDEKTSARKSAKGLVEVKKREMLFDNIPKKGDLDLDVVKDSVYFFS